MPLLSQSSSDVVGKWYTENKETVIKIYKSGDKYYGKIVWLKEPKEDNGKMKKDKNNPKKSKRSQTLVGLVLLKGFVYQGDGEWAEGTIYDPENGKTYKARIRLKGKNKLDIRGYVGVPAFGRSTVWTRY
jgi:uncharacterized protein (DUF2147 family)